MIPARTNRAHLEQRDPRCDTVTVLNMAARRLRLRRFADMNAVAGREDDWNLHWADGPEKNHFTHILNVEGRIVRMPATQRHKPVWNWASADIRRWRKNIRRKHRHPRYVRPFTVAERQRQAKRRLVVICWELKSPAYRRTDVATRMVGAVTASGWKGYYMTLVTMRSWGPKLRAIKQAGGETALLAHSARRPAALPEFSPFIDRTWGRFR